MQRTPEALVNYDSVGTDMELPKVNSESWTEMRLRLQFSARAQHSGCLRMGRTH